MSLDISLKIKKKIAKKKGSGIFIRENGQTKEITREEWDEKFPNREPVKFIGGDTTTNEVFDENITHNMNLMAQKAGLYFAMWRPEEKGWEYAKDIILPLESGIILLKTDPTFYKQFDPDNGWGSYKTLLEVAEKYLAACKKYPEAKIEVSR